MAFEQIGEYIPEINLLSTGWLVFIFFSIILGLAAIGAGTYYLIRWLKFNKTIVILEDVQGSDDLEPIGKDKAMLVKVAKSGMEVLYLRKRKTYKGAYGKRMGKNRYYFAIGPDGYWYNVTLGSLKDGLKTVNVKPTPVNMRYQNEALQEIIKERYNKTGFLEKYGGMIAFTVLIMLFGVMAYILIDKFAETAGSVQASINLVPEIQQETKKTVSALDKVASNLDSIVARMDRLEAG